MARTLWVGVAASVIAGCSGFGTSDPTLEEGDQLEVTDHGAPLPTSREAYTATVTFATPQGGIQIVDPGTGLADPPRLLRTLRIARHVVTDAQIASDGYLWVATPDSPDRVLQVVYVVDPHLGTVHRAIRTPDTLSGIAGVAVGPDDVYVRAIRSGFSGGIGAVPRTCVSDESACDVRFLAELGNVGGPPERALHYEGGMLYSFNNGNSRDQRFSTVQFDPQTGGERAALTFSGNTTFDADRIYMTSYRGPGLMSLDRLDKATLQREASQAISINTFQVAYADGRLYATDGFVQNVKVYDAESLTLIETIDVSAAGPDGSPEAAVDFLAPNVLMLNHHAWLNTATNEVVADGFPLREGFSAALRFPEGYPHAD